MSEGAVCQIGAREHPLPSVDTLRRVLSTCDLRDVSDQVASLVRQAYRNKTFRAGTIGGLWWPPLTERSCSLRPSSIVRSACIARTTGSPNGSTGSWCVPLSDEIRIWFWGCEYSSRGARVGDQLLCASVLGAPDANEENGRTCAPSPHSIASRSCRCCQLCNGFDSLDSIYHISVDRRHLDRSLL